MTEVLVLSAPACHLCEDAIDALGRLEPEFTIRVRVIGMETPEGHELSRLYRPAMPPAVIVDGVLFSVGRLPRNKLRKLLERAA